METQMMKLTSVRALIPGLPVRFTVLGGHERHVGVVQKVDMERQTLTCQSVIDMQEYDAHFGYDGVIFEGDPGGMVDLEIIQYEDLADRMSEIEVDRDSATPTTRIAVAQAMAIPR